MEIKIHGYWILHFHHHKVNKYIIFLYGIDMEYLCIGHFLQ